MDVEVGRCLRGDDPLKHQGQTGSTAIRVIWNAHREGRMPPKLFKDSYRVSAPMRERTIELLDILARDKDVSRAELLRRGAQRLIRDEMFGDEGNDLDGL